MKQENVSLPMIKLAGITVRTQNIDEMDIQKAKIGKTINKYFTNNFANAIKNRVNPGILYCAYTNYASDENGEYTFFVGEKVSSFDNIDDKLMTLNIPASNYVKFQCGPGQMPMVCVEAWKKIWQMSATDLGGNRSYITDFEIYDERAQDSSRAVFDIYIGICK